MSVVQHYQVAIIGAGFSGTMVAAHLTQLVPHISLALFERNPVAGVGLAYGTTDPDHLLNVRAGQMGAFPNDPEHFWRWLQTQPSFMQASRDSFVPRLIFGQYLKHILTGLSGSHPHLDVIQRHIVSMNWNFSGRFELVGADGAIVTADRVVLALGNFPPEQGEGFGDGLSPYVAQHRASLADDGDVLIVGTGLTSLDLIVTLAKSKRKGAVHLLSRHGLLPREHVEPSPYRLTVTPSCPATAVGYLRMLRRFIADAPDLPWQNIIDAFRPFNQKLWQSLTYLEQKRFLRHLRSYWDVHRHRCAPQVMDAYRFLEKAGRLQLHHGSIVTQTFCDGDWDIVWRQRGSSTLKNLHVRHLVRCTGPQADIVRLDDKLVQSLLSNKQVTPDPLHLGVAIAGDYNVADGGGKKTEGIYALGSLLKGKLYESVAVPELRHQAAEVAALVAAAVTGA